MEINPDFVPSTIEEAINHIVESLDEKECEFIRSSGDSVVIHHTVGRYIRNNWSLWSPDTPLKRDAVETYQIAHADDISGLIFDWVYAKVQGIPFDPQECCERFHEHWAQAQFGGQTSLEAGGWPPKKEE